MSNRIDPSIYGKGAFSLQEGTLALNNELKVINMEVKQDSFVGLLTQGMLSRFQGLHGVRREKENLRARKRIRKSARMTEGEGGIVAEIKESVKERAARYQEENEELDEQHLIALQSQVNSEDDQETILNKIKIYFQDWSLVDEVLDFLSEGANPALLAKLNQLKERIRSDYGREIVAGRNMGQESRFFSKHGLGSPALLRKMYLDITGNPRTAPDLFEELSNRFSYPQLRKVIGFLLRSLGADLRSKGPSISHGELFRLLSETRVAQAILGVFRFFKGREKLVNRLFSQNGLDSLPQMSFEIMAKTFMRFVMDRFPSPENARHLLGQMGVHDSVPGLIILGMQVRDALREVDPYKLFGYGGDPHAALLHKEELAKTMLEVLEGLEDEYEDILEEEEESEKDEDDSEEDELDEDNEDDLA
ncbi:HrpJ domain-containing protein [Candidatus Similichlamydia laticola]|uniref:Low Calcium Response E (CopN) (Type III secreted protein SctW) n=1 Tax=Candidatus Similichlamydia laticola TaxID=2170265 RepID=A0A369KDC5_9BACT|nr:HrpJ domain-containing protein [Candidatus Similichlamydia laticola]RDB31460.1 Low Calcium Response E (CopN) (Type III secreted protein SctW) [Candidatus Similichlamydia laticola]